MHRYVVVAPLVPLSVGDRFSTRDWPLHVTLVPTFFSAAPLADVVASLARGASDVPVLEVVMGPDALFGPRHTVPVSEVVMDETLRAAHAALVGALRRCEITFESPPYAGPGFRAHVTHRKGRRIEAGQTATLEQVALVDMAPGQELGQRAVLAVSGLRAR